jgi:hypothetical protein
MTLQPPKRRTDGYYLAAQPPITSPRLACDLSGCWTITTEWSDWATTVRDQLVGELVSHGNWFSRPPRRDLLEPLFAPWAGKKMQGALEFFCQRPESPGSGTATWILEGLVMSATSIVPVWKVSDFAEIEQDTISLFGDGEEQEETREIQFDDIELESPAAPPTRMRNREWEARKFLAKERVREFRLKAQIADRLAAKEEARFQTTFGDLDDDESHFSEYDLTENEDSSDSEQP